MWIASMLHRFNKSIYSRFIIQLFSIFVIYYLLQTLHGGSVDETEKWNIYLVVLFYFGFCECRIEGWTFAITRTC